MCPLTRPGLVDAGTRQGCGSQVVGTTAFIMSAELGHSLVLTTPISQLSTGH